MMLGASYFIWRQNKDWYEMYDIDEDTWEYKVRLTEKAPPEAVESFRKWQEIKERAKKEGIIY